MQHYIGEMIGRYVKLAHGIIDAICQHLEGPVGSALYAVTASYVQRKYLRDICVGDNACVISY